jgi:hypothetical protein
MDPTGSGGRAPERTYSDQIQLSMGRRGKEEPTSRTNGPVASCRRKASVIAVRTHQSYANKQQHHQAQIDNERWSKEFQRAQRADKYRAFFETSVLATDPTNPDKRLVGYALLQEFVDDDDYNSKATRLLEESLVQELRSNTAAGLDEQHRNMVLAIVTALSESTDCKALGRAARSIDKIAKRHAVQQDADETAEIYKIYVRRLVGRAALICKTMKELDGVRHPLVETMLRAPEIAGAKRGLTIPEANAIIARAPGQLRGGAGDHRRQRMPRDSAALPRVLRRASPGQGLEG